MKIKNKKIKKPPGKRSASAMPTWAPGLGLPISPHPSQLYAYT